MRLALLTLREAHCGNVQRRTKVTDSLFALSILLALYSHLCLSLASHLALELFLPFSVFLSLSLVSLTPVLPLSLPLCLPAWQADISSPREVLRCGKEPWL